MKLEIMWLGQGGFILENDLGKIAIDPFCGAAQDGTVRLYDPAVPPEGICVDLAISTHAHWDHFDPCTYRHYIIPQAIAGPPSCMAALTASGLEVKGVPFGIGDRLEHLGFTLNAVYADHDGDSIGVVAEYGGHRLYFSGDTKFSSFLLIRNADIRPDVSFICINGKFLNMDYSEAALYSCFLRTKVIVPTHYDLIAHNTEDPRHLLHQLPRLAPDVKGFIMERGRQYQINQILE